MAAITFDTLKFVRRPKDAGVPERRAKAKAEALAEVVSDVLETQLDTEADVVRPEGELKLIRWMLGLAIGGVPALVLKAFVS